MRRFAKGRFALAHPLFDFSVRGTENGGLPIWRGSSQLGREVLELEMTSQAAISTETGTKREDRIRAAFYRGDALTVDNPAYVHALRGLADELLRQDTLLGDATVDALGIGDRKCAVEIRAKDAGVAAGVSEAQWLYDRAGLVTSRGVNDGDPIAAGNVLLRVEGDAKILLSLERLVVNLMQRMSGIATVTRKLVEAISRQSPNAHVVATRKTPWGVLDKRAVHVGGGGTHRLSLGDAILIKTNHLLLAASGSTTRMEDAIRRAWANRKAAAFFEVEVTSTEEALLAARALHDLQASDSSCPCVLMLDNFSPAQAAAVAALRERDLHDAVLFEASGNVAEASLAAYAAAGVDVISIGALTHSARALDLSAKLIPGPR
ncbi:MAG: carboxylating nicotinate-nucleotide diphosphorylase [Candidatus Acidiferrales bacterium]